METEARVVLCRRVAVVDQDAKRVLGEKSLDACEQNLAWANGNRPRFPSMVSSLVGFGIRAGQLHLAHPTDTGGGAYHTIPLKGSAHAVLLLPSSRSWIASLGHVDARSKMHFPAHHVSAPAVHTRSLSLVCLSLLEILSRLVYFETRRGATRDGIISAGQTAYWLDEEEVPSHLVVERHTRDPDDQPGPDPGRRCRRLRRLEQRPQGRWSSLGRNSPFLRLIPASSRGKQIPSLLADELSSP